MGLFGEILSLILDYSPIGNIKSGLEGLSGYNSVTFEKLDDIDRVMCFVGLIPVFGKIAGNVAKKLIKSAKGVKRVTKRRVKRTNKKRRKSIETRGKKY